MNPPSSSKSKPRRPLKSAKHADPSTHLQSGTTTSSNQSFLSRQTNDARTQPSVHEHQPTRFSLDNTPAQPYHPMTRPWAFGYPTEAGVSAPGSSEMTPLDRWISQDISEEMWNNVHGVYGAVDPVQFFGPPTPLNNEMEEEICSNSKGRRHKTGSANWSLEGLVDGEGGEEEIGCEG